MILSRTTTTHYSPPSSTAHSLIQLVYTHSSWSTCMLFHSLLHHNHYYHTPKNSPLNSVHWVKSDSHAVKHTQNLNRYIICIKVYKTYCTDSYMYVHTCTCSLCTLKWEENKDMKHIQKSMDKIFVPSNLTYTVHDISFWYICADESSWNYQPC